MVDRVLTPRAPGTCSWPRHDVRARLGTQCRRSTLCPRKQRESRVRRTQPLDSNLLPEDHPYVHPTCIACNLIDRTMAERVGPLFVLVRDGGLAAHVPANYSHDDSCDLLRGTWSRIHGL